MDLVCYMILYEFDKKKMGFHANCGFEKRKKKKMVPPLSESLTRFTTRVIERNTGGKQGGKLMVPMYAKTIDKAAEELEE